MNEVIIASDITANCANGSVHLNVVMKAVDGVIVYETADGTHLCGDCCVKTMDKATVYVGAAIFGAAVMQYRKQEVQS